MTEPRRTTAGSGAGGALYRYAPSRLLEPALSLLSLPILTRLLGVERYGELSILLLSGAVIRNVFFDWVGDSAMRFRLRYDDQQSLFFTNLAAATTLAIMVGGGVIYILRELPSGGSLAAVGLYMWWVFADSAISGVARSGEMVMRATKRPVAFTISRAAQGVSRHILVLAGLVMIADRMSVYFGVRIAGLVLVSAWSWLTIGAFGHLRWRQLSWSVQGEFLRFGLPLSVALLSGTIRVVANRYVVLVLQGSVSTGLYSAAANIGGAPLIIFQQIVMLGLYPLAIDAWEKKGNIYAIVHDGLRYFFLVAVPALAGMVILARPILTVVAGPRFAEAAPVLVLLAFAAFVSGLNQYFSLQFMVARRTGIMAVIGIATGMLNIGLSVVLVRRFGYEAAAVATVAANFVLLVATVKLGQVDWQACFPWRSVGRASLATALMVAVAVGLDLALDLADLPTLLVQIPIAVLVYGAVLWRTGEVSEEIGLVRGRWRLWFGREQ